MPTGLLGQTFDADSKKRMARKEKAQGEGAIDGVYTDYMIDAQYEKGWDEWFT